MTNDEFQCDGCGMTGKELKQQGWDDEDIENEQWVLDCGTRYCHRDCYRDCR
jgi:hypothetical protein